MASGPLLIWQDLKKSLRQLLKKYKKIDDFIVFGSLVKGKYKPQDVDIALVIDKKDAALVGEVKGEIKAKKVDLEMATPQEIYQSRLGLTLITEGFSIKNNKYLKDLLGIKPRKIYTYQIKHLSQTKKVLFGRGLNQLLKKINGIKLGAGSVMLPVEKSGSFEDFLETWELKYKTKEYLVF